MYKKKEKLSRTLFKVQILMVSILLTPLVSQKGISQPPNGSLFLLLNIFIIKDFLIIQKVKINCYYN